MKQLGFTWILSLILFISCDPCKKVDCPSPFISEELLWLPYLEGDQLVFLDMNSSDSLVYSISHMTSGRQEPQEASIPYCVTACFYRMYVSGDRIFSNGGEDRFSFVMYKFLTKLKVSIGSGYTDKDEFKLANAVRLDSVMINGSYIKDVYKYSCKLMQDEVAETYMHQGMGLVKIVFRDGQSYELVEHIRSN